MTGSPRVPTLDSHPRTPVRGGRHRLPAVTARPVPGGRPWVEVALTALGVAAVDLVTKSWGSTHAGDPEDAPFGIVRVGHVLNRGAALGLGASHPTLVAAAEVAGIVVLLAWLTRALSRAERLALAVAVGGAAGNLIDRLVHGAVTDWIQVPWYHPTFNLADVAVRGGLLIALALRASRGRTST